MPPAADAHAGHDHAADDADAHGGPLWHTADEALGSAESVAGLMQLNGIATPDPLPGYAAESVDTAVLNAIALRDAWQAGDAAKATAAAGTLATALQAVGPAAYPSAAKRNVEVYYNKLAKLTLPGAALYCVAFALFLVSAYSSTPRLRLWGPADHARRRPRPHARHRRPLVARREEHERLVPLDPDQEPVRERDVQRLVRGAVLALVLEMRRKRPGGGLFGAAGSFVGWLSLLALFASPFVFGKDIGGEIKQAQGILMSYWLYIHVTMVTASYALIGMSFLLATWWLAAYYTGRGATLADANAPVAAGGGFPPHARPHGLPAHRRPDRRRGARSQVPPRSTARRTCCNVSTRPTS